MGGIGLSAKLRRISPIMNILVIPHILPHDISETYSVLALSLIFSTLTGSSLVTQLLTAGIDIVVYIIGQPWTIQLLMLRDQMNLLQVHSLSLRHLCLRLHLPRLE